MSPGDVLTALLAAVVWGLTFLAIKYGVGEAPPLLLSALRFAFAAFPAILFVRPPKASFGLVTLYGLLIGVGQFGLLFIAIEIGMPVGLASLVMQLQVFVTIAFAVAFLGERPTRVQLVAAGVALLGICVIGSARLAGTSLLPFLLTLVAAGCWGAGNFVGKLAGRINPLALIVWSSLVAPAPMLALSFGLENGRTLPALLHPSWLLVGSVAMLSYGGSLIGFGLWSRLLMRYPAAMVAPFALLVPVISMVAAGVLFGERISAIELAGAVLVMAGLSFNVLGERLTAPRRAKSW